MHELAPPPPPPSLPHSPWITQPATPPYEPHLTINTPSLRRRFQQNQEDCTFTVLALLPTATANILEAMDTERITYEIQTMKAARTAGAPPSIAETNLTDEDGKSIPSVQSESGVHASQITVPPAAGEGPQDGGADAQGQKSRKTKRQLWDDLTISCESAVFPWR